MASTTLSDLSWQRALSIKNSYIISLYKQEVGEKLTKVLEEWRPEAAIFSHWELIEGKEKTEQMLRQCWKGILS